MKITNLLEQITFKKIKAETFNMDKAVADEYERKQKQENSDGEEMMGRKPKKVARPSGEYGFVKPNQHEVIKQPHVPQNDNQLDADGYHHFIKIIQGHKNIHFPKVYKIVVKQDSSGLSLPQYNIERLIRTNDVPKENLDAIIDRYTNGGAKTKVQLCQILGDALETGDTSKIAEDSLKSAVEILHKGNNGKFEADLHFNNIMFRFAGGSYQLVIIDPYAELHDPVDILTALKDGDS